MMGLFGFGRRTVAEEREEAARRAKNVLSQIQGLQRRIKELEKKEPFERNDNKRRRMALDKLRIESQIKQLESRHHQISGQMKG